MKILIDTEFISVKNRTSGVIFRCAILVFDELNRTVVEEYDLWCNYNLFKMFKDSSLWSSQLKWLNSNEQYNGGYVIKPVFKYGMELNAVRQLLYQLVGKYKVYEIHCKGFTPTDQLLSKLPFVDIQAPKFDGVHEPLQELYFYKDFV
jgi:hypothetical protein